ncbi:DUF4097 family beta strand repeat-containing protein [Paenibacillus sp. JCM 10914]|uniref:DUF4097 family beta strand repeat-containing protein n=1 Tax=Paenibacillus sp. JCM 10914 TaxID=1236974 RepID=UPI0003CC82B2|nr:DUF4097 family beta strand repeat-containing protein [Paenibacillus sp. JCM 10914]GAE09521.1 hypothetical protein JCM10914_5883 [Paenibacillus sp. JCM 10914]
MKLWKHSLLRIALTCIVIGLVGNLILYFLNASPFNVEEINENKSFNNDINNIQINTAMDDIRIERVSGNTITLSRLGSQSVQYTDRLELTTSVDNGTLYISVEELKKHRFTISARYNVALTLSVPDKIFDSITVTTITGDIHLNNIRSNDIALNSNTGHIHASDTYSRINNIRTITGDINLDGNLMSLKLYSTTGKIAIKLAELAGTFKWIPLLEI